MLDLLRRYGGLHPTRASSYVVAILYFPLTALAVARALSVMAQYFVSCNHK